MGSFVGNLVTRKKRKKLNALIQQEAGFQTEKALASAELEREGQRVQQVRANVQMSQERLSAVREARIRRAQVIAAGTNAGAGAGTAVQNASASIYSQLLGSIGVQNVFAGFSQELSDLNDTIAGYQSEIIASQGKQTAYGAKLQTQQEKANLIGGAIDMGLGVATAFLGPVGMFSAAAKGASMAASGFANLTSTASRAASGASSIWGTSGGNTSIFSNVFR